MKSPVRRLVVLSAIIISSAVVHGQPPGAFSLAPLFADGMVLQQRSNVPVWGTAGAGATVHIKASWGADAAATAAADGTWKTNVHTPKAGGPFTMTVTAADTAVVIKDILAGEVWLASGQSNMEMPVEGWPPSDSIMNAAAEIRNARYPSIRMFTVHRMLSLTPESTTGGMWVPASPETAGKFSATGYFFARAIHKALGVPVGIIHSSWGGTRIEPWISGESITTIAEHRDVLKKIAEGSETREAYAAWMRSFPTIDVSKRTGDGQWAGLTFDDDACSQPGFDDSQWREMMLPMGWENSEVGDFDGVVWFRKTMTVPASWVGKQLAIELGPIDDMDVTFVNGVRVGGMETGGMWNVARTYTVPDSCINDSSVSIAIRVVDTQGGGGLYGKPEQLVLRAVGTKEVLSIAGNWRYLPVANYDGRQCTVFGAKDSNYYSHPPKGIGLTTTTPSAIYNAMIAPLVPYTIRGAIWYQGESNTSDPKAYATLLPLMIGDWRSKFAVGDFPFYYVQIAPFGYGAGRRSELLREAQLSALGVKNAGMAVTLDIGSARTIHPWNKQDVGGRLALWALAKTYGKKTPYSGPRYTSMKREKNAIVLSFDHAGKGLVLKKTSAEFMVAGEDKAFKPAVVRVRGSGLVVSHPGILTPAAVRYAFTDTSSGILFNSHGLPASSFRTDTWNE